MGYSLFLIVLLHNIILCISVLPELHQIVYVNSPNFIVVNPKQIHFNHRLSPSYFLNFNSKHNGSFYQLSNVFSKYGYVPYQGKQITNSTVITGSKGRFVYRLKNGNNYQFNNGVIDSVNIVIHFADNNKKPGILSGKIVFLPKSGTFVSSDFLLSNDGWKIMYNHPRRTPVQDPTYCNWNHNDISMFITGTDNYVNLDKSHTHDNSLWYFRSPAKYNIDLSLAYLGWIDFSLVVLSGDFSKRNNLNLFPIIKIACNNLFDSIGYYSTMIFNNNTNNIHFHIKLDENLWTTPYKNERKISKQNFIRCLSDVNSFEILGDWTSGIETVGLDSVRIYKV
jgi:hypothetical protein